jgi:uncharacterized protein YegP (UPF0339 family)
MKFQIYMDTEGNYRWRLRDEGHELVAVCAIGHGLKSECERSIELMKNYTSGAKIEDLLLKPQG